MLFIIFKRLELTKKIFQEIKKAKPKKFYIACDGAKNEEDIDKVKAVREYIMNNIDWPCDLKTRFREENLGVGFGPADAITWFFENEEMGIIFEDDCLLGQSFFGSARSCWRGIRTKKIFMITGTSYLFNKNYLSR